jgi:hypothetical protein
VVELCKLVTVPDHKKTARQSRTQEMQRRARIEELERFDRWRDSQIDRLTTLYQSLWSRSALAHRILLLYPDEVLAWNALAPFYHREAELSRALDFLTFAKASSWLESDSTPRKVFGFWRNIHGVA